MLLLPLLVLWRDDRPLYSPPYHADPWFYLGYMLNLVEYKRDLFHGLYYGGRLSWILAGFAAHSVFPPVAANAVLHLAVQSTAVFSFFAILRRTIGERTAFLAAMMFSVQPWLWAATGWNYPDGAGIAFFLLAMALAARAGQTGGRVALVGAGMAVGAMVSSHLFLATVAPLVPLFYLAMSWRRAPARRLVASFALWAGAGFAAVMIALGAVNYALDGNPWFFASSIAQGRSLARDFRFTRGIWIGDRLSPWLWPSVVGLVAAVFALLSRGRDAAPSRRLFAALLLLTLAYFGYLQLRGMTVLAIYPYASYLLPLVFLTVGSTLMPAVETMRRKNFAILCAAAAAVFASTWAAPQRLREYPPAGAMTALGVATVAALGAAFLARGRSAGPILAVAGLSGFTAIGLHHTSNLDYVDVHGHRAQFERIVRVRERIEAARQGRTVRFWYDRREPNFHEYYAMNGVYMAEFSRVGQEFPEKCGGPVEPGALIVVPTDKAGAAELASAALSACWKPWGVRPAVESVERIEAPRPYALAILRAEADPAAWRPLGAVFDAAGRGRLEASAASFPLERWTALKHGEETPLVRAGADRVEIRTARDASLPAAQYGPIVISTTGRYRFALHTRDHYGRFLFAIVKNPGFLLLGGDGEGRRVGERRENALWLDLKAGDEIALVVSNHDVWGYGAARLAIVRVEAALIGLVD